MPWWHRNNIKTLKVKLVNFQRTACLTITGGHRKTPTTALEIISGLCPLDMHIEAIAGWAALGLKTRRLWTMRESSFGHTRIIDETLRQTVLDGEPTRVVSTLQTC